MAVFGAGTAFAVANGSDFDTAGELSSKFEVYTSGSTPFIQGSSCGLANTGCIDTTDDNDTLARQLAGVTFPSAGNSISAFVYFKTSDNNGYATLGFTGQTTLDNTNTSGFPLNPMDAISFNAHGGGYVIQSGPNDVVNQGWDGTNGVTNAHPFGNIIENAAGHWFKESITLTRVAGNDVNVTYKVEEVNDDATTFGDGSTWAEFTVENVDATDLVNAGTVYPYFGNSDPRATTFDNFDVPFVAPVATSLLAATGGNVTTLSIIGFATLALGFATQVNSRRKTAK